MRSSAACEAHCQPPSRSGWASTTGRAGGAGRGPRRRASGPGRPPPRRRALRPGRNLPRGASARPHRRGRIPGRLGDLRFMPGPLRHVEQGTDPGERARPARGQFAAADDGQGQPGRLGIPIPGGEARDPVQRVGLRVDRAGLTGPEQAVEEGEGLAAGLRVGRRARGRRRRRGRSRTGSSSPRRTRRSPSIRRPPPRPASVRAAWRAGRRRPSRPSRRETARPPPPVRARSAPVGGSPGRARVGPSVDPSRRPAGPARTRDRVRRASRARPRGGTPRVARRGPGRRGRRRRGAAVAEGPAVEEPGRVFGRGLVSGRTIAGLGRPRARATRGKSSPGPPPSR